MESFNHYVFLKIIAKSEISSAPLPKATAVRGSANKHRVPDGRMQEDPTLPVVCAGCPKKHARSLRRWVYNPTAAEPISSVFDDKPRGQEKTPANRR